MQNTVCYRKCNRIRYHNRIFWWFENKTWICLCPPHVALMALNTSPYFKKLSNYRFLLYLTCIEFHCGYRSYPLFGAPLYNSYKTPLQCCCLLNTFCHQQTVHVLIDFWVDKNKFILNRWSLMQNRSQFSKIIFFV